MFVSSLIGLSLVPIVITRHKNLSVVLNSVIDMDALWDTQGLLTVRAPERSLLPLPTSPFRFNRITPFTILEGRFRLAPGVARMYSGKCLAVSLFEVPNIELSI